MLDFITQSDCPQPGIIERAAIVRKMLLARRKPISIWRWSGSKLGY